MYNALLQCTMPVYNVRCCVTLYNALLQGTMLCHIVQCSVTVYNVEDESTVIGAINLTVKCLNALDAVKAELQMTDKSTDRESA